MRKRAFLIVMCLILVFVIGCKGRGSGENKNIERDYHIGTDGLEMNFLNNAPPNRIYVGDDLEVILELRNKGAWPDSDVFDGKLEVSGFDLAAINGRWEGGNEIQSTLRGKGQFLPEGGYTTKTYKDSDGVNVPSDDVDVYSTDIIVASCYKYKTQARPVVCIDPDPFAVVQEDKVCQINDNGETYSTGSGQGGPVSVSSIRQEVGKDRIYFRIYLRNAGGGSVIEERAFNDCPFDLKTDQIDKVKVGVRLSYDANPDCSPRGTAEDPVRLTDGQGTIFCSFTKPATTVSAFTTPLEIDLSYVYSSSIKKKIDIINLK